MRRLFVLLAAGAAFFALVATAFALTNNTVSYKVTLKKKGRPSAAHPAVLKYRAILNVGTTDGKQPNVAPTTVIFFPKQIVNRGKYFRSCTRSEIDGHATISAKCRRAQIGGGTAIASAGRPGQPEATTIKENLTVRAFNGPKGRFIFLAVSGTSPLTLQNRVIPGKLGPGGGPFGYRVTFTVPPDLQFQLGFQVALIHFDVTIPQKTVRARVGGRLVTEPYLGLTSCPRSHRVPSKVVVHFDQDGAPGQPAPPGGQIVPNASKSAC